MYSINYIICQIYSIKKIKASCISNILNSHYTFKNCADIEAFIQSMSDKSGINARDNEIMGVL